MDLQLLDRTVKQATRELKDHLSNGLDRWATRLDKLCDRLDIIAAGKNRASNCVVASTKVGNADNLMRDWLAEWWQKEEDDRKKRAAERIRRAEERLREVEQEANEVLTQVDELVDVPDEPIESVVTSVDLTCGHEEELVSKDEVVVTVADVSMDEMDVGPEFQKDEPMDAILVDIGNEEAHVPSIEPPLHCVVPAYSLQVHAPSVDDIGNVSTLAGSLKKLKDIQAAHIYHDPFLVHCTPFDFIVADWFAVHIRLDPRTMAIWFTSLFFMAVRHSACLITYVRPRLLFDPGGFEDESFRTGRE